MRISDWSSDVCSSDLSPIRSPRDLSCHNCLVHALKSPTQYWNFHHAETGEPISVRVQGTIRSTFGEALRHSALLGDGIAMHPTYMVAQDLQKGDLKIVLPDYTRSEEHTSELQSLMRISYAVFCLK